MTLDNRIEIGNCLERSGNEPATSNHTEKLMVAPLKPASTEGGSKKAKSGGLKPAIILSAVMLLLAAGAAIFLVLGAVNGDTQSSAQPADVSDAALASEISHECSMGGNQQVESTVTASLAQYLSGLKSGAKVSTSDVGALIEKITPNPSGLAFYRAYTDCLKQQTAIFIERRKGIDLVAPPPSNPEAERDQNVLAAVNQIKATTPSDKLKEIFGSPIFTGKDDNSNGFQVDLYQYNTLFFVADYRRANGQRAGIVLATKSPESGKAMMFEQIRGVTIGAAGAEGGRFTTIVRTMDAYSPPSMVSEASQRQSRSYYFSEYLAFGAALQPNMPESCKEWDGGKLDPEDVLGHRGRAGDWGSDLRECRRLQTGGGCFQQ